MRASAALTLDTPSSTCTLTDLLDCEMAVDAVLGIGSLETAARWLAQTAPSLDAPDLLTLLSDCEPLSPDQDQRARVRLVRVSAKLGAARAEHLRVQERLRGTFAAFVLRYRMDRGLSIAELADAMGMAEPVIAGWERGVSPSGLLAHRVCEPLELDGVAAWRALEGSRHTLWPAPAA